MKRAMWFPMYSPLLLLFSLLCIPPPAEAQIIYNGLTRYPTYEIYDSLVLGFPPPSGYGHFNSSHSVDPVGGFQYAKLDLFVRSDWPWPFARHDVSADVELGSMRFFCTRTGPYSLEASGFLNGFAAICVPQGPHTWGGAEAGLKVEMHITLYHTNLAVPIPMYGWKWTKYDRFSQYTLEDPVLWNDDPFLLTAHGVTLYEDWSYALSMSLKIVGHVGVTGGTQGGYILAAFDDWNGSWLSIPYDIDGYSRLSWLRITNDDPDLDAPFTQVISPTGSRTLLCPEETITLQAQDPTGGFGMGQTYWRFEDGPVNTGTGPIVIPESGVLEYWSVDLVGNQELPHTFTSFTINNGPVAPVLLSIPDGQTVSQQQVTLAWSAVAEAEMYRLQVDDDPAFGSPEHDIQTTNTNTTIGFPATTLTYFWRLCGYDDFCELWGQWSDSWSFTINMGTSVDSLPVAYGLAQNHPNPFNPQTAIRYDLPQPGPVQLRIYDVSGRLVRTLVAGDRMEADSHEVFWNGRDDAGLSVAAGIYIYRLDVGDFREARRMTLMK